MSGFCTNVQVEIHWLLKSASRRGSGRGSGPAKLKGLAHVQRRSKTVSNRIIMMMYLGDESAGFLHLGRVRCDSNKSVSVGVELLLQTEEKQNVPECLEKQ